MKVLEYDHTIIDQIEQEWRFLETGEEMTIFQSYDWFCSIVKDHFPPIPDLLPICFLVLDDDDKPILIAPLLLLTKRFRIVNGKKCFFWGRTAYSDYLNFVYKEFNQQSISLLFLHIKKKYNISQWRLDFIREDSSLANYLLTNKSCCSIQTYSKSACAQLLLPSTLSCYQNLIPKHAKQNIRTANNRAHNDGVVFKSIFYDSELNLIGEDLVEKCYTIWESRLAFKSKREKKESSVVFKIKKILSKYLAIKFSYAIDIMNHCDIPSWLHVVYCGDDVAAFFWGVKDRLTLRVILAGTNQKYYRYSPGLCGMHSQIESWIENSYCKILDFTRGDEKYKMDLGCSIHRIYDISFSII